MSFVLQCQPGAITELEPYAVLITGQLQTDAKFRMAEGQSLGFLGVSLPVGTCARGRCTHVAVFVTGETKPPQRSREQLPLAAFAVLARALSPEEFHYWRSQIDSDCLTGVELLDFVETRGGLAVFRPTGRVQAYVNLV